MTMMTAAKDGMPTPTAIPITTVLSAHLSETRTVLLQSQPEINYTKFTYYKPFAVVDNDMRTCQET